MKLKNFKYSILVRSLSVLLCTSLLPSTLLAGKNLTIFSDDGFKKRVQSGSIPLRLTLLEANQDETQDNQEAVFKAKIRLLQSFADSPFFPRLLDTFEEGKDTVLKRCSKELKLHWDLIFSLCPGLPEKEDLLTENFSIHNCFRFDIWDPRCSKPSNSFVSGAGNFIWWVQMLPKQDLRSHRDRILFLLDLLSIPVLLPDLKSAKKDPLGYKQNLLFRHLTQALQVDVHTQIKYSPDFTLDTLKLIPGLGTHFPSFQCALLLRLAIATAYQGFGIVDLEESNSFEQEKQFLRYIEDAAAIHHKHLGPYLQLLRAQYLLHQLPLRYKAPLSQNQQEQALALLHPLEKKTSSIDHLALLVHLDWVLTSTEPSESRVLQVTELLERGFATGIPAPFHRRKAEYRLGFFGGPMDLPAAMISLPYSDAPELQYRAAMGHFGKIAINLEYAQELMENHGDLGYFTVEAAAKCLREKRYKEALILLIPMLENNTLYAAYWIARIQLDSRSGFSNPKKGLLHMIACANFNYRDAQRRVLSLHATKDPELFEALSSSILEKVRTSADWSLKNFHNLLKSPPPLPLLDALPAPSSLDRPDSAVSGDKEKHKDKDKEGSHALLPDPERQEEDELKRMKLLEADGPMIFLSREIEDFMDSLHLQLSQRDILKYVQAMGGEISGTRISFPGVEGVFNFHLAHNGSDTVCLTKSYWRNLHRMVLARYEVLVSEALGTHEE